MRPEDRERVIGDVMTGMAERVERVELQIKMREEMISRLEEQVQEATMAKVSANDLIVAALSEQINHAVECIDGMQVESHSQQVELSKLYQKVDGMSQSTIATPKNPKMSNLQVLRLHTLLHTTTAHHGLCYYSLTAAALLDSAFRRLCQGKNPQAQLTHTCFNPVSFNPVQSCHC